MPVRVSILAVLASVAPHTSTASWTAPTVTSSQRQSTAAAATSSTNAGRTGNAVCSAAANRRRDARRRTSDRGGVRPATVCPAYLPLDQCEVGAPDAGRLAGCPHTVDGCALVGVDVDDQRAVAAERRRAAGLQVEFELGHEPPADRKDVALEGALCPGASSTVGTNPRDLHGLEVGLADGTDDDVPPEVRRPGPSQPPQIGRALSRALGRRTDQRSRVTQQRCR